MSAFIFFGWHIQSVFSQNYDNTYFISPLNIPHNFSGSFGELRANHFHSGLDFKANMHTPVLAVADGFVSRIKVSPWGYGYALYLTHPNGYVSQYGHLEQYNKIIANFVKQQQYKLKNFTLDIAIDSSVLKVKQGDTIAFSGNSGSSGGPHLHFEIRDEKTEETINPLLFGIKTLDNENPEFSMLKIYPADIYSTVNGENIPINRKIINTSITEPCKILDTINVSGNAYFGIECYDRQFKNSNKNGIYKMQISINNQEVYNYSIDKLSFSNTRHLNDHIDFAEYIRTKKAFQTTKTSPGNKLSIYNRVKRDGCFYFKPDSLYSIHYIITDFVGNKKDLLFTVKGAKPNFDNEIIPVTNRNIVDTLDYETDNIYRTNNFEVEFPIGTLMDRLFLEFQILDKNKNCFSKTYSIQNYETPLYDYLNIKIKPDTIADSSLFSKLLMVYINKTGAYNAIQSKLDGEYIVAKYRSFGKFTLKIDTIAPVITPINVSNKKNVKKQKNIRFMISDNLSGVESFDAYLNQEWVLVSFDGKSSMLQYDFDEHLKSGENLFQLIVKDAKGNVCIYSASIFY
ncbi:MAG: M23 family metallopeptidase [Bacteroidota bacterium]